MRNICGKYEERCGKYECRRIQFSFYMQTLGLQRIPSPLPIQVLGLEKIWTSSLVYRPWDVEKISSFLPIWAPRLEKIPSSHLPLPLPPNVGTGTQKRSTERSEVRVSVIALFSYKGSETTWPFCHERWFYPFLCSIPALKLVQFLGDISESRPINRL